jgi:preprotein translocase subunit SecD
MKRRSLLASLIGIMVLAFVAIGATLIAGRSPLLGLDLRGGVEIVETPVGHPTASQLTEVVNIINERVNAQGIANSTVQRQGDDIVIELPGDPNQQAALKSIGATAQLYFRPLECNEIPAYVAPAKTKAKPKAKSTPSSAKSKASSTAKTATTTSRITGGGSTDVLTASTSKTTATTAPATTVPATTVPPTTATTAPASTAPSTDKTASLANACTSASAASIKSTTPDGDDRNNTVILPPGSGSGISPAVRFVLGPADASGEIISKATAVQSTTNGAFSVQANLTSKGNVEFNKMAAVRNAAYETDPTNPPFTALEAIELDGSVESTPAIQNSSFAGSVQITGNFTQAQATDLATELQFGAFPIKVNPSTVSTISATLGSSSLRAGLYAGLGGIILVLLYMIAYYRGLGLVVVLGLVVGGSLLFAILTELSRTKGLALTLEGVTGIIVSVGITVDSYVVYFERLKDEVRKGQTIRASVERGFARAFRTVLTADLVSFLAALILYLFTVGDVKGFAFTLGLSTLLDVFTAYFFIRPIVILLGRRRGASDSRLLGVARGLGATSTAGGLAR